MKEYSRLKCISCRKFNTEDNSKKIRENPSEEFTLLYNESRISFAEIQKMIICDNYKDSKDILIVDKEIAENLSDAVVT